MDPIRIVQEAGRTTSLVWKGAKNLVTTYIRFLDRPGHSESLYRLSYSGPLLRQRNVLIHVKLQVSEEVKIMLVYSRVYFVLFINLRSGVSVVSVVTRLRLA